MNKPFPTVLIRTYLWLAISFAGPLRAQEGSIEKIAASQAGSSSLQFQVSDNVPLITTGSFLNDAECTVRNGLPHFISKLKTGVPLTVAFLGGSITQNELSYRSQTARYIGSLNTRSSITWINAGIAGTGADLGACRLQEQVMTFRPDLVFIEFAVNGAFADGVEGMIRQIKQQSPETDICLIYTVIANQVKTYQQGSIPANIIALEKVAVHYGIPSIHLAMEAAEMVGRKKLIWQSTEANDRQLVFSRDGIHPSVAGGNLYAAAIARGLQKMINSKKVLNKEQVLPSYLTKENWANAGMYEPSKIGEFSGSWIARVTATDPQLKGFKDWFGTVSYTDSPGSSFSFQFYGGMFGLFDIGGPEAGFFSVQLDGKEVSWEPVDGRGNTYQQSRDTAGSKLINRFNMYCNNRYRGQYVFLKVAPGDHKVTIRLSGEKADKAAILGVEKQDDIRKNPSRYAKTVLTIGRILICGRPTVRETRTMAGRRQTIKLLNFPQP